MNGITNHVVPIPGSTVTAYLGHYDNHPSRWVCSLWTGEGVNETLIATADYDIPELATVNPDQVARIAFLLEVEYAS